MRQDNQARIFFSGAIIASFLAYIQTTDRLSSLLNSEAVKYGSYVLAISALFSFFYILFSAAELKYENNKSFEYFFGNTQKLLSKYKKLSYDISIDCFMFVPLVILARFIVTYLNSSIAMNSNHQVENQLFIVFYSLLISILIFSFGIMSLKIVSNLADNINIKYGHKFNLFVLGAISILSLAGITLYGKIISLEALIFFIVILIILWILNVSSR